MSKMRRNPVTPPTPPDFDSSVPAITDEWAADKRRARDEMNEVGKKAEEEIRSGSLSKVMTNDQTPLCPFCLSPKLEPISADNPWGRKWVCNACCTAFREPVRGKTA